MLIGIEARCRQIHEVVKMLDRKTLIRSAVAVLVALHNVASYGNPTGEEANEYLMVRAELTVAAGIPKEGLAEINAATPVSSDQEEVLEEIIVVRKSEWRLPDLGSSWRAGQEAREKQGRTGWELLPRYDLEQADRHRDLSLLGKEEQRVGFIQLFRFSFGRRF